MTPVTGMAGRCDGSVAAVVGRKLLLECVGLRPRRRAILLPVARAICRRVAGQKRGYWCCRNARIAGDHHCSAGAADARDPRPICRSGSGGTGDDALLLAAGNLGSVHMPRATDPTDVWRKAAAGKTQALAIFISPLLAGPVLLAYLARYAFDSQWAFWGAMAVCAGIAGVAYWMALE